MILDSHHFREHQCNYNYTDHPPAGDQSEYRAIYEKIVYCKASIVRSKPNLVRWMLVKHWCNIVTVEVYVALSTVSSKILAEYLDVDQMIRNRFKLIPLTSKSFKTSEAQGFFGLSCAQPGVLGWAWRTGNAGTVLPIQGFRM